MRSPRRFLGSRKVPFGLLGAACLVLLIELFIQKALEPARLGTEVDADWRRSGRLVRRIAPKCEVLCFGDSLIKCGIVPKVLQEQLGVRSYNFALACGQVPASYVLLRRALDAGARPRAVVLDTLPSLLSWRPDKVDLKRPWQELLGVSEGLDLARELVEPNFFLTTVLGHHLASLRNTKELRAEILAALRGQTVPLADRRPAMYLRNFRLNQGALILPRNDRYLATGLDESDRQFFPPPWECDPVNTRYLERFFALAESRGIPVFWVMPPICPEAQDAFVAQGGDAIQTAYARRFQERFRNLIVVDARQSGYSHTLHADPLHLNGQGATTFTRELAAILAPYLRPGASPALGRWIALRPCPPPADPPVPLEDLMQSRLALQGLDTLRR